jgi:hypothetical protein
MAGVENIMQITSIDENNNLFKVESLLPDHLVEKVLATPWLDLEWDRQQGQETWTRRRIRNEAIPWQQEWDIYLSNAMPKIEQLVGRKLKSYIGTGWWLDEPGFTCAMHTDGDMPGALQMTWIAAQPELGTCFYNYKDPDAVRYQFLARPNSGYIMLNNIDASGYRQLQWHAMLTPVPANTYRLSSYTWITPYHD